MSTKTGLTMDVYRDVAGEWRWRMLSRNGRIVADSAEGYKRRERCIEMASKIGMGAKYGDALRIDSYRDIDGQHRWRVKARNGRIVGDCGEGYQRKSACERMAQKVASGVDYITIED